MTGTADASQFSVRSMREEDADDVLRIFRLGRETLQATFETADPSWTAFSAGKLPAHRFVAVGGTGRILGWAMVSPTSSRQVYDGVVEVSVPRGRDPRAARTARGALARRRPVGAAQPGRGVTGVLLAGEIALPPGAGQP